MYIHILYMNKCNYVDMNWAHTNYPLLLRDYMWCERRYVAIWWQTFQRDALFRAYLSEKQTSFRNDMNQQYASVTLFPSLLWIIQTIQRRYMQIKPYVAYSNLWMLAGFFSVYKYGDQNKQISYKITCTHYLSPLDFLHQMETTKAMTASGICPCVILPKLL